MECCLLAPVLLRQSVLALDGVAQPTDLGPQRGILIDGRIGSVDGNNGHDKDNKDEKLEHLVRLLRDSGIGVR
jgi:hypothetical protein